MMAPPEQSVDTPVGCVTRTTPLVSVVIPTYNRAQWLPLSVGSATRQTYSHLEILVVDDGSTDDSANVVAELARHDPRVRYLTNQRGKGVSGARNTGIDAARGEFVAFLDSDDEWFPEHLASSLEVLLQTSARVDAVSARAERRLRSTGERYAVTERDFAGVHQKSLERGILLEPRSLLEDCVVQNGIMEIQTLVVRRSALESLRFAEDLSFAEDIFFSLSMASRGLQIAFLPEIHLTYWAHEKNTTTAGGSFADPHKIIRIYQGFEQAYLRMLRELPLTRSQRTRLRRTMAWDRFWKIGYQGYLPLGKLSEARASFRRAIWWQPQNFGFWKTYLGSYVKAVKAA